MFQDAYVKLDRLETEDLLSDLTGKLDGGAFDPQSSIVMARALSFYPGYKFYDVADHKTLPPARRFVIKKNKETTILDFTNTAIYDLNQRAPIQLNKDNIADYARFFFSFVRGRHGKFIIIESIDDIPWREEPPPAGRKAVAKMIAPVTFQGISVDGSYYLTAQMLFKDSLFGADIYILPNGQVKISGEKLLIEDMPVLDDSLGQ
jgi:hypothetical protein